uniref:Pyrin domain-containing protein n=1 Tax=Hippocampus comes TaxID=109280 RepID=A0A3Q2Y1A2_HIPCM
MSDKKLAIADALANLTKAEYDKFCMFLVDGHGERRVPLSKVEGKNFLEVTNVLVNFFTEDEAMVITSELLTLIGCLQQAKELSKSPLCVCVCVCVCLFSNPLWEWNGKIRSSNTGSSRQTWELKCAPGSRI